MIFRTEFKSEKSRLRLDPEKPVVMCGSCFTQNIAAKMNSCLWKAVNPLGTLYNPESIGLAIDMMTDGEEGVRRFEKSLFQSNGIWNSWRFDSSFSSPDKENCIKEFRLRQKEFVENFREGKTLIVTFGTSICYYEAEKDQLVANCHKLPANCFRERRLKTGDVFIFWHVLGETLKERFGEYKIIFTVSPVRHLKNGFAGNSKSKAVLLLGIEEICGYDENCFYFPAFEIMNDDLRDYRFYADDMCHPSEVAVDYIWDKFVETYVDDKGQLSLKEGEAKVKASLHRPKTGALGLPLQS